MKAPNGKPTNLSERQWLQVRTPSFLKWFGDWINDPENASKILDENGEPKVVRFSLMNQLDTDDNVSYGYLFAIEGKYINSSRENGCILCFPGFKKSIINEGFFSVGKMQ